MNIKVIEKAPVSPIDKVVLELTADEFQYIATTVGATHVSLIKERSGKDFGDLGYVLWSQMQARAKDYNLKVSLYT